MLKVPGKLVKHMDAQYDMQQCSHCMFDDQTKWDPAHSHGYMYCNRRGEKHNNSYLRNRFGLIDDEEDHSVCPTFFADTFGISKTTLLLLTSYAGKAMLPTARQLPGARGLCPPLRSKTISPGVYRYDSPSLFPLQPIECV